MKTSYFFILAFFAFTCTQTKAEDLNCNTLGNPNNSCNVTFSHFSFGQNFSVNGTDMFFFDYPDLRISKSELPQSANVPRDSQSPTLPIRFFILSSDEGYNSAMSLIHTAYTLQASINVIFKNPVVDLLKNDQAYYANRASQSCFVNRVNDKPFSLLCPVMSITLTEN